MSSTHISSSTQDFYPDTAGSSSGPTAELVTITPEMAKDWVSRGTNFRSTKEARIASLASAIEAGHWELNGETIKFSRRGHLMDGQHRLSAIVKAGIPCPSFVVYGIPEGREIDRGSKRTLAQQLSYEGVPNSATVAAVCRIYLVYQRNVRLKQSSFNNYQSDVRASMEFCHANAESFQSIIKFCRPLYSRQRILPLSVSAAFMLLAGEDQHTRDFIQKVYDLVETRGCPSTAFRRWLESQYRKNAGNLGLNNYQVLAVLNRAWNSYAQGKEIDHMKVTVRNLRWSPHQNPVKPSSAYGLT